MQAKVTAQSYLLMFILLFLWGSFAAISKWSMQDISSWQMQFYMFFIALLIMISLLPFKDHTGQMAKLTRSSLSRLSLYGLLSYLYYAFYTASLKLIPATEASMLNYFFPVLIVMLSVLINREKLTRPKLLLLCIGIVGTIIIITNGHLASFAFTNLFGDVLALLGAVSWALFTVLGQRDNSPLFVSIFVYVVISCICSMISLFVFSEWIIPKLTILTGITWIAFSNIVLSYFIWFRILQRIPTALVSGMSFITPFITLLFIFLLLGEQLSWVQCSGFILIMLGVILYRRLERE